MKKRGLKKALALLLLMCFLPCILLSSCNKKEEKQKFTKYYFDYFDTATTIVGYENTQQEFDKVCAFIEAELETYHKLYNIYDSFDQINNIKSINEANLQNKAIVVDEKIVDLLSFCKEAYTLTKGRVNVAMGSVLSIWHNFRTNGLAHPEKASLPSMDELENADNHTAIERMKIDFDKNIVSLLDPKMSLDVGAVAKGYAVEQIGKSLYEKGIAGYLLNIGGNIKTIGSKPDGEGFYVGIENPDQENEQEPHIAYLKLTDMSLVTSGNYQRFYEVNGKRYHHIIDPATLMPSEYFSSVSIVCKSSAVADALSTALFTMSLEEGKKIISEIDGAEALWVTPEGKKYYSDGFKALTFEYKK